MALGLLPIDRLLPGSGLAAGALHEVAAAAHGDRPAAFGFAVALAALMLCARAGPAVLVAQRRSLSDFGSPYGHGLERLGLDPGRLMLVEAGAETDALWAIEETLRSKGASAMVLGLVGAAPDLKSSRRLSLAAAAGGAPLLLIPSATGAHASAAATRWRIGAAPAPHSASAKEEAFARARWSVALERCRNGGTGHWLIEWDHVALRFHLAQGLADRAPGAGREQRGLRLAG
jgi:protein ImuA